MVARCFSHTFHPKKLLPLKPRLYVSYPHICCATKQMAHVRIRVCTVYLRKRKQSHGKISGHVYSKAQMNKFSPPSWHFLPGDCEFFLVYSTYLVVVPTNCIAQRYAYVRCTLTKNLWTRVVLVRSTLHM